MIFRPGSSPSIAWELHQLLDTVPAEFRQPVAKRGIVRSGDLTSCPTSEVISNPENPKHIAALFVTNDNPGGYWEDKGYNWFSGS